MSEPTVKEWQATALRFSSYWSTDKASTAGYRAAARYCAEQAEKLEAAEKAQKESVPTLEELDAAIARADEYRPDVDAQWYGYYKATLYLFRELRTRLYPGAK